MNYRDTKLIMNWISFGSLCKNQSKYTKYSWVSDLLPHQTSLAVRRIFPTVWVCSKCFFAQGRSWVFCSLPTIAKITIFLGYERFERIIVRNINLFDPVNAFIWLLFDKFLMWSSYEWNHMMSVFYFDYDPFTSSHSNLGT